jgi:hypothetical protein
VSVCCYSSIINHIPGRMHMSHMTRLQDSLLFAVS